MKMHTLVEREEPAIGCSMMYHFPAGIEVMRSAGIDYVMLDLEHGELTANDLPDLVRTCDAVDMGVMVRVTDKNNESEVMKALDAGATGIVFPNVKSREEAEKLAALTRFAPQGDRGYCPFVRGTGYGSGGGEVPLVVMLIESKEGVRNLDEIIAVPEVDLVSLGSFDLSCDLGEPGNTAHPVIKEAAQRIMEQCAKQGKRYLAFALTGEDLEQYSYRESIGLLYTASPVIILKKSYQELVKSVKAKG